MTRFLSLALFLFSAVVLTAQQDITLEDIWQNYEFSPKRVPGFTFMNDGQHYTRRERGKIVQYNLLSGEQTQVLFDAGKVKGQAGFDLGKHLCRNACRYPDRFLSKLSNGSGHQRLPL